MTLILIAVIASDLIVFVSGGGGGGRGDACGGTPDGFRGGACGGARGGKFSFIEIFILLDPSSLSSLIIILSNGQQTIGVFLLYEQTCIFFNKTSSVTKSQLFTLVHWPKLLSYLLIHASFSYNALLSKKII